MRGSTFRLASAALLVALTAALTYRGVRVAAQQPPVAGIDVRDREARLKKDKDKEKKDDRPAGDETLPIGLPYDRDARQQLKAARDYLYDTSREHLMKALAVKVVAPLLADGKVEKAEHDTLTDKFRNLISPRDDLRADVEKALDKRLGPDARRAVQADVAALLDKLPDLTSLDDERRSAAVREFDKRADAKSRLEVEQRLRDRPWNTISPLLQNILNASSDSFFTLEEMRDGKTFYQRISIKTEANRIIAAFPREGLQFYQQAHGQDAADLLAAAARDNYDLVALSDLSQRYFHTRAGGEATSALATLYLERGNYLEAAYAFERLLGRPNSDEFLGPRTLYKAALAMRRSTDPRHASVGKGVWEKLDRATKGNGLTIGRRTLSADQLRAELDRPVGLVRTDSTVSEHAMLMGNAQRNGTAAGGVPFLEPSFRPVTMFHAGETDGNSWIKKELERVYNRDAKAGKGTPIPGFFPVATSDLVIFRSYDGVHAYKRVGDAAVRQWWSHSEVGMYDLMTIGKSGGDVDAKSHATTWWNQYGQMEASAVLHDNPLIGSLAHDGEYVYYVDDVALPPPPLPTHNEFGNRGLVQAIPQTGRLGEAIKAGRLAAINIRGGNVVWELGRPVPRAHLRAEDKPPPPLPLLNEEEADRTTFAHHLCLDAVFLGPPMPLNGRLYVLIEQAGVVRLLCLDPRNMVVMPGRIDRAPALVWSQKLGKPNTRLPADSIRRFQGAFLAAAEGVVVCPTNSGAVVAVDTMSRSLLWAHAYRQAVPQARVTEFDQNGMPRLPKFPQDSRWRAAAPIISGGRVVITAFDSPSLDCIDLRTGRVLWQTPRQPDDLYVGGVVNDRVIVVGRREIRAYHLAGETADKPEPKLAWGPVPIPTPTGHGAAGKSAYFVPVRPDNAGKEGVAAAEIWAVDVATGAVTAKAQARKRNGESELARFGLGNLVYQDGVVYAQSAWEVSAYPQLEQKRAEMDRRLKDNPNDPFGLTDRGELLLDDGKVKAAIDDFKAARKNLQPKDAAALDRRLREKLHDAYRELCRTDFAAAEPFLKEYEALCEVPLDTDDPHERQARADETLRRKREFLNMVARGREGQDRLGEAFDTYVVLANLGGGKQLIPMPDDGGGRVRPDVWARGRIEAMIRGAKDPAARELLEQRVVREWDKVRTAADLPRLREFVGVFGPYFPAGAEAQFKLAELLLGTNNEADAREAQGLLSHLRAAAAQPVFRARAVERLARLMEKHEMEGEAVGLYQQLGREFPAVVVRDGKTGADFYTDVLTDKRLLPFLEPSRYPLPARVKAELVPGAVMVAMGGFEVEPEGELLPAYRRLRFQMNPVSGNSTGLALSAYDRGTGAMRHNFTNVGWVNFHRDVAQTTSLGNLPFSKMVRASGSLIVTHVGPTVRCFDMAERGERKERWHRNLLGEGVEPHQAPIGLDADGEYSVRGDDGTVYTLGHSAVLQPGYVCLRTKHGLEAFEPATATELWKRTGVGSRARLYGDPQFVLVVEHAADGRPTATKLIRAADGSSVPGSADAGRVLAAATSYRAFGRTVLLAEGGDGKPRVVRLLDLATGADVWRKEYDPKAAPLRALSPEWCGAVLPTGEVEVLAARTGQPVAKMVLGATGPDHMKACHDAQLLADGERFYVVLDKDATGARQTVPTALRSHRVNGPLYCFDRTSGRRLWFYEDVFDNQMVVLDQFAELPVLVSYGTFLDPTSEAMVYRTVVLEKARGLLLFNGTTGPVTPNSPGLQSIVVDATNRRLDLQRHDMQIRITEDDAGP